MQSRSMVCRSAKRDSCNLTELAESPFGDLPKSECVDFKLERSRAGLDLVGQRLRLRAFWAELVG